ncbi:MAG TPA: polyisoprenoid-binding protein [Parvularcula sp.]|nr:polyisoprenoid-binding protein [Parvularcula sp.]HBS31339.1 polyisoprenoid-binding protein [Parvularcula sp.]HBS34581.1 polyisoprenoid-binding protein [Parvularcula sp.]
MTRLAALYLLALAACAPREKAAPAAAPAPVIPAQTPSPAGTYRLDRSHASLLFKVDHIGFSNYTGQFRRFDATLAFDPKNPAAMAVEASIDVTSLDIPAPPEGFLGALLGPDWLDAGAHPAMTYRSTRVTLTAPEAARVEGDLTFHGVTAPVVMDVTFNGGYESFPPYDPNAHIGFSARGVLNRSVFGVTAAIPTQAQPFGVGDAVAFEIEAEFSEQPAP